MDFLHAGIIGILVISIVERGKSVINSILLIQNNVDVGSFIVDDDGLFL